MNTEYEFINEGAALATQVFVWNDAEQPAVCNCDQSAVSGANFSYRPWQFLNASVGAREFFCFSDGLALVARPLAAGTGLAASKLTPVLADHHYLAFPAAGAWSVTDIGSNSSEVGATEVTAAGPGMDPFELAIDWYLDRTLIGTSQALGKNQSARFKNSGSLCFLAVGPENPPSCLTPQDLDAATAYQAAPYVRKVLVKLSTRADGHSVFSFSPPRRTQRLSGD